MKEVLNVAIEPETKEVLDSYKEKLDYHDGRIVKLEIDSEVSKEKLNNITAQLTRIETNALATNNSLLLGNNSILSTMNKVIEGNTTQSSNKKEIWLKILGILGGIITTATILYFAAKGINVNVPTF